MTSKRIFMALVAVVVMVGGYVAWQRFGSAAPLAGDAPVQAADRAGAAPVPVTTETARRADVPVVLQGLGQAQALNTVTVHSQVSGQIDKVFFKQGETVKQGDLLVQIVQAPFQAAVAEASGKLAEDQADLNNNTIILQRDATLAKSNFDSAQTLQTQQALVNQEQAAIRADQASLSAAQIQLGYTQIRAPIAGHIGFRLVDAGNIVEPTSALLSITQIQPIHVAFSAPGDQVDRINKAMQAGPVKVTALSDDGQRTLAEGTLSVINNTIDTTTATIALEATFPNNDNALWPGLSVETNMVVATLKNVLVVPVAAVQHGPDGLYAFVVGADNKVTEQPIEVGNTDSGVSVVAKGLAAGAQVVTDGAYRLQNGTLVAATDAPQNQVAQDQTP